jgi:hypothetical protein
MASISLDIKSELPKLIKWTDAMTKQLPYAISQSLNDMGFKVRNQTRAQMPSNFTIRRPWVINQVDVISRSTKRDLSVTIGPKPAAPFLNRQELGGLKLPRGKHVAIPTKLVRRTKSQLISKADRPAQLIAANKVYIEQYRGNSWIALKGGSGAQQRGSNRNLRFLYLLTPQANVKPRLGLRRIGLPIVRQDFKATIAQRLEQAMASAR